MSAVQHNGKVAVSQVLNIRRVLLRYLRMNFE
jgi:hypothetical protein